MHNYTTVIWIIWLKIINKLKNKTDKIMIETVDEIEDK